MTRNIHLKEKVIINVISTFAGSRRFDNFLNLLNIIHKKKVFINVVLQEYSIDKIKKIRKYVDNVIICKRVNPAYARNKFLRKFYNSKYKYFIFLDDDVILDAKLKTEEKDTFNFLIQKIQESSEREAIVCLEENNFVYRYIKNPDVRYRLDFWASFFIMKNLKLFYNKEIYFDYEFDALEERDFAAKLYRNNLYVKWFRGQCAFSQLLHLSTYGNKEERRKKFLESRRLLYEKNKDLFSLTRNEKILELVKLNEK